MNSISFFLEKYKHLLNSEEALKQTVIESIFTHTRIRLTPKEISIKNGTLYVPVRPIMKNELFIKKDLILKDIETKLSGKKISNLR